MTQACSWQPTASMTQLKKRSAIIARIRQFFAERAVWEVDTPALSQAAVTDVHLHSFSTSLVGPGFAKGLPLYLMTSPEFHMKRLLAAGSGAIYQISKAFRNEEAGRYHNPEFTMLEWYRPDFDHHQLMDEMDALLQAVLRCQGATRMSYQAAFQSCTGLCPLRADIDQLRALAATQGLADITEDETDKDTLLQLLFSVMVEPNIGQQAPAFVYDFPASQAALAKISEADPRVAHRFEVYFQGIELANGFYELQDAQEQRRRFEADNAMRVARGLRPQPIDQHLLAALDAGLPDCAGVALGIDRLVMLALGCDHIDAVTAFPVSRA
ncbi:MULTISPECIES: elongation factor P--(R)-beta-lysine ligase [unclassified Salinivibrio]|uniref:elongation factor P--(R)-beta-lysine ligase n=1 Tax=unclassified Salinivibrio TaxID=2636825 RepID=UPI00084CAA27|nr:MULTISPECIES: elongation factor P--(R)-beta-lysine ligase [unclassified Salinivibrio]ODP98971.1 elongation factor P lysine(34) lysyltransferase [Salinivibrio sp. DV]PCE68249.1 elongation factor P lysine(34) lysyltransferase [Salinivibrio sp. YCSC6]QCF34863.1 elongation factor P--(R)-beta-lysine ligase [Salinivibrio sp. YCSC6]